MKNKILSYALLIVLGLFVSCERDDSSIDKSKITYFVDFQLEGGIEINCNNSFNLLISKLGEDFVDPGFNATENDEDVANNVKITTDYNKDEEGIYSVNYSVENIDGFPKNDSREILVYDNSDVSDIDISGVYLGHLGATSTGDICVIKLDEGIFYIDNMTGGYYTYIRKYPLNCDSYGYMKLKPDNTLVGIGYKINYWGDKMIMNGVYNPVTKEITHGQFKLTLKEE